MLAVYVVNISAGAGKETVAQLLPFVAEDKQARIRRFYRWQDSLRTLFADLLIRHVIIQETGLKNEEISFTTNDWGKPFLDSSVPFHFNLSHSGAWVVGAVDNRPVGIDVEEIAPVDLDISERYFSRDEHSDLLSKPDKIDYFFTLWTLKESYIKFVGKGLSLPLNSFSIRFLADNEIRIKAEEQVLEDIFFRQYNIDEKYKMAVCARHKNFPGVVVKKTIPELIEGFSVLAENFKG